MINLLASLGLCWVLMYGEIVAPERKFLSKINFFKKMLSCALCIGFWCGLVIDSLVNDHTYFQTISSGLASAAFCWFADLLRKLIENLIILTD